MEILFDNGSGMLYKQCLKWIQEATSTEHHILTSAILILGNFGRTGKFNQLFFTFFTSFLNLSSLNSKACYVTQIDDFDNFLMIII